MCTLYCTVHFTLVQCIMYNVILYNAYLNRRGRSGGDVAAFGDSWVIDRFGRCTGARVGDYQQCAVSSRNEAKQA